MSESNDRKSRVVHTIRTEILDGRISPGTALRQIPLAEEHSVSQTVIRECLQSLEQQGLVTKNGQRGFAVRAFDVGELVDAYRVREVLEGLAASLCCRKASRDDVDALRMLAHGIHDASGEQNRARRSELESQFHQTLLRLSGNETLERVSVGYRFVGNLVVTNRDPASLLMEHLAIVDAIAENRSDDAEALARQHVRRSADSIAQSTDNA